MFLRSSKRGHTGKNFTTETPEDNKIVSSKPKFKKTILKDLPSAFKYFNPKISQKRKL